VESGDCRVQNSDRAFAEVEVLSWCARVILYARNPISKCVILLVITGTYRCTEDQCLLEVAEVLDLFAADAMRHVLQQRVELFEGRLAEDRLNDVTVNLFFRVLAEATFFGGRGDRGHGL
jgi:hypothetical protein